MCVKVSRNYPGNCGAVSSISISRKPVEIKRRMKHLEDHISTRSESLGARRGLTDHQVQPPVLGQERQLLKITRVNDSSSKGSSVIY